VYSAQGDGPAFLVKDINRHPDTPLGSSPRNFMSHRGMVYFFANEGAGQPALWRTDGRNNGTEVIKRFGGGPTNLTVKGLSSQGKCWFSQ
jgi:ELWxxDGT repeat protein